MAKKTNKKDTSKNKFLIGANLKEILAVATAFTTLLVALGGEEITQLLSGDKIQFGEIFVIVASIIIAMVISYLIIRAYRTPENFVKDTNHYIKYAPAISSIIAGMIIVWIISQDDNIEAKNFGSILQDGIYVGLIVGIFFCAVAYVFKSVISNNLKNLVEYSKKVKSWKLWLTVWIFSFIMAILVIIFTELFYTLDGLFVFLDNNILGLRSKAASAWEAIARFFSDGNYKISYGDIARYILAFILASIIIAKSISIIRNLLIKEYQNQAKAEKNKRQTKEKRKKQANRKRNSPSRK